VREIIKSHVEQVNRDLAADGKLSGSQIRRFVLLHKLLDADDGELTRTRKVRRSFIADKYGSLIEALFSGDTTAHIETEVTYEDGRKGSMEADLAIVDVETSSAKPASQAAE
jgi:long-chain acyl-CoA synthetase